jgi:hypothetical protein
MIRKSGLSLSLCLLLSSFLHAQSPNANDEILKLVKSGMPESVVIDKIHDAAGRLDTSADALIALKNAGATAQELAAITARPQPSAAPATPAANAPIPFADGLLYLSSDEPYIEWSGRTQTVFPNNDRSNRAYLAVFEGKPAFRIPTDWIIYGRSEPGNLLITSDRVLFDPYGLILWPETAPKNGQLQKGDFLLPGSKAETKNAAFSLPRAGAVLMRGNSNDYKSTAGFRKGDTKFYFGLHLNWQMNGVTYDTIASRYQSPLLLKFIESALKDFDIEMARLLQSSGIQDPDRQLGQKAHFTLFNPTDFEKMKAVYQSQLDHGPPMPDQSNGWAQLGQVLSAGGAALQQSQAGGNTIAAQAAAKAQYDQSVTAIMNGQPAPFAAPAVTASASPITAPATSSAPAQPRANQSAFKFNPPSNNGGGTHTTPSSGTAAPPVAPPPTTSSYVTTPTNICPASGFIPGVMKQSGDTAVGVPCTPGQPIGSTPSTAPPTSAAGLTLAQPVDRCVTQFYVNDNLSFTNNCTAPLYVEWYVGSHSGSWTLGPGETTHSGYSGADVTAGGSRYYACPQNYSPVDASYNRINSAVSNYTCRLF